MEQRILIVKETNKTRTDISNIDDVKPHQGLTSIVTNKLTGIKDYKVIDIAHCIALVSGN